MADPIQKEIAHAINATLGAPLAEASQLIADKIRYIRWKSAVKTLERAAQFARERNTTLSAPPLKFFLPFMEGCSLEEPDGNLVEQWARLLTTTSTESSSTESTSNTLIFTRILREIGPLEAKVMQEIFQDRSTENQDAEEVFQAIGHYRDFGSDVFSYTFKEIFGGKVSSLEILNNWEAVAQHMRVNFSSRGICLLDFQLHGCPVDEKTSLGPIRTLDDGLYGELGEAETLFAIDVLAYHRLVEVHSHFVDLSSHIDGSMSASIHGVNVTSLGAHFSMACLDQS